MLEQAIIDAKELKEAAQKNANEAVIEKYQHEIKEAVDKILEQDELGMEGGDMGDMGGMEDLGDMGADAPAPEGGEGATEAQVDSILEQLPFLQATEEGEYVNLNLSKLEESLNLVAENELFEGEGFLYEDDDDLEYDEYEDDEGDEDVVLPSDAFDDDEEDEGLDGLYPDEDVIDVEWDEEDVEPEPEFQIAEETDLYEDDILDEEMDLQEEDLYELKKAQEDSRILMRENKNLIKSQTKFNNKAQLLESKLDKYGTIIGKLKDKLDESNLQNAKLLYQNRVLDSVSLNERQKDKIVEAIINTNSVEEAKIVFETLQSSVGIMPKRKVPDSLNEVVTRSSSAFIPRKKDKERENDPFSERMKTLAGLK
jgi:hypothetical protein